MTPKNSTMQPRGIRNNNPMNIEYGDDHWQGLTGSDGRFAVFKDMKWGVRAATVILINYQRKYKLETIQDLIFRWAPPHENASDSYADAVASHVGVDVLQKVDVLDPAIMLPMLKAMITVENGKNPIDDSVILDGMQLAGVDVKKEVKPLIKSRTLHGVGVGMVGTVVGFVLSNQDMVLSVTAMISPGAALVLPHILSLLGLAYAAYARIDDAQNGVK